MRGAIGRTYRAHRTPPNSPHRRPAMHPMAFMPWKVLDRRLSERTEAVKFVNDGLKWMAVDDGFHSSSLNACRSEVFKFLVYSSSSQLR